VGAYADTRAIFSLPSDVYTVCVAEKDKVTNCVDVDLTNDTSITLKLTEVPPTIPYVELKPSLTPVVEAGLPQNQAELRLKIPVAIETYVDPKGTAEIMVTNNADIDLADYQVKIVIDQSMDDFWVPMSIPDADVYFEDASGNPLYYWKEKIDKTNRVAILWVKVPSLPAKTCAIIYMKFGKVTPPSGYHNPDQVFEFFEDFTTDPNTNGKWEVYRYSDDTAREFVYDSANRRVYLTKAVNNKGCFAFLKKNGVLLDCPEPGFIVRTRGGAGGGTGADGWAFGFHKDPSPYQTHGKAASGGAIGLAAYDGANNVQSKGYAVEFDNYKGDYDPSANHIALVDTLTTIEPETHHAYYNTTKANEDKATHDIEIRVYNGVKVFIDGEKYIEHSLTFDKTYKKMGFGAGTGGQNNKHWIQDYVIITKYVEPEPTVEITNITIS